MGYYCQIVPLHCHIFLFVPIFAKRRSFSEYLKVETMMQLIPASAPFVEDMCFGHMVDDFTRDKGRRIMLSWSLTPVALSPLAIGAYSRRITPIVSAEPRSALNRPCHGRYGHFDHATHWCSTMFEAATLLHNEFLTRLHVPLVLSSIRPSLVPNDLAVSMKAEFLACKSGHKSGQSCPYNVHSSNSQYIFMPRHPRR